MNVPMGIMVSTKLSEVDGGWLWEVSLRGRLVERGFRKSKKEAQLALQAAAGKLVVGVEKKKGERHMALLRFKTRVMGRPYLAAVVLRERLNGGGGIDDLADDLDREEAGLYRRATGKEMVRHPAQVPAAEMGRRMWADMGVLWPVERTKQMEAWARRFLGDVFVRYLEGELEGG